MRIFRKKPAQVSPKAEALAGRIAARILQKQTLFANFLNRKTRHWDHAAKLTALILFVLVFGILSCYYIIKSF